MNKQKLSSPGDPNPARRAVFESRKRLKAELTPTDCMSLSCQKGVMKCKEMFLWSAEKGHKSAQKGPFSVMKQPKGT
jgi:hypothetical protein